MGRELAVAVIADKPYPVRHFSFRTKGEGNLVVFFFQARRGQKKNLLVLGLKRAGRALAVFKLQNKVVKIVGVAGNPGSYLQTAFSKPRACFLKGKHFFVCYGCGPHFFSAACYQKSA